MREFVTQQRSTRVNQQKRGRGGPPFVPAAAKKSPARAGEIVRTAMSLSTADPEDLGSNSVLLERVIDPAVRRAGENFLANLGSIRVEQMCETAERTHVLDDEKVAGDFAI